MWDIYRGEREVREGKRQKLAKYIKYMYEIVKEQNQLIAIVFFNSRRGRTLVTQYRRGDGMSGQPV